MENFFIFMSTLTAKRGFRVFMSLLVLGILVGSYLKYNSRFVDRQKLSSTLGTLGERIRNRKDRKTEVPPEERGAASSVLEGVPETLREERRPEVVVKKQLGPDAKPVNDMAPMEEKIKGIANIHLKLKILEDSYLDRRKKNRIDRSRTAREGDFVYYSMETLFDIDTAASSYGGNNYPKGNFFMKILRNDVVGKKLIGKKVGQVVEYSYSDLTSGLPEKDRIDLEESFSNLMTIVNNEFAKYGLKLFNSTKIKYRIVILDFIARKMAEELALGEYTRGR
jgi:hypothetical protein